MRILNVTEDSIEFDNGKDYGFRFGNPPVNMFFVPCYSIQNGYYSSELDIWYDGKEVIHGIECPVAS